MRVALGVAAAVMALLAAGAAWLRPPAARVPTDRDHVLAGVTLVEPGSPRLPDRTIEIAGGRIARISESEGDAPGPYAGRFVLPGLVDLHVHHPPGFAPGERKLFALLFLAHGVTSVRDVGSAFGSLAGHARRIRDGEIPGPRLFACGPFLDGDPPTWPTAVVVRDADEATRAVAELAAEGVDCVKVYNGLSLESYEAVRDEAARRGLPVVAHVPRALSIANMRGAEVQHLMGLSRRWRNVDPARIAWYAETSRTLGIAHTPTLAAFAASARAGRGDPAARFLPPYHREVLWSPARNPILRALEGTLGEHAGMRLDAMKRAVAALRRAGVPIRVGTDAGNPFVVPGASLHEELRLLVESGLAPEDVWRAATIGAGEALGVEKLGTLRPGAPADLLVFGRDPTRSLDALDSLEAVIADGRLYSADRLAADLEAQQAHFQAPLRAALEGALARGLVSLLPDPGPGAPAPRS